MDPELRDRAIMLHDDYTHRHNDRRTFLSAMMRLAGSAAAAELLIARIAADPVAATVIAERDPRIATTTVAIPVAPGRTITAYRAAPKVHGAHPAVVVIHENRGLQPYTRDVARRLAVAGYVALAPDLLSPSGGTPANDDDRARSMIQALDLPRSLADVTAIVGWLAVAPRSNGRIGVVGFCWGGAMADRVAVAGAPGLRGVVAFYGPAPPPSDAAEVKVPLQLHFAGRDTRVDKTAQPWLAALKAADKPFESFVYPNVDHAFHNDASAERYDPAAAALAWGRTLAFFRKVLA